MMMEAYQAHAHVPKSPAHSVGRGVPDVAGDADPAKPDLVKAAVEGRLPRGIGVERLRDQPAEWSRQFEALGLKSG
jgi:hypothetical protein